MFNARMMFSSNDFNRQHQSKERYPADRRNKYSKLDQSNKNTIKTEINLK